MEKKIKCIVHKIRHNDFLNKIFEGKIMGRRPRGKPRMNCFSDIEEKMGCISYQHLEETVNDRHNWLLRQGVAFKTYHSIILKILNNNYGVKIVFFFF